MTGTPRARVLSVAPAEYYADPCETPSLTQSIAHTLLTRSPAHAWTEHPRFGNTREESSKAADEGTLIHALLLGKGADVEIVDAPDFRTTRARELRDAAIAEGRLPVLEHKYQEALTVAEILRKNIAAYGIAFDGESEVAIEWREPGNVGEVLCRGLMDHVVLVRGAIYDLKKIRQADPRTCARHAFEYGYDIQHAAYTSALEKLLPELAGRIDFVFLFLELTPPYAVVPCRPDGVLRELGERRWARAVQLWEHCLLRNHWPTYTETITTLEAPPWAITEEERHAGNI